MLIIKILSNISANNIVLLHLIKPPLKAMRTHASFIIRLDHIIILPYDFSFGHWMAIIICLNDQHVPVCNKLKCYNCVRISVYIMSTALIHGILPKGPYPPCLRTADRALLAGYPRYILHLYAGPNLPPARCRSFVRDIITTGTWRWRLGRYRWRIYDFNVLFVHEKILRL